ALNSCDTSQSLFPLSFLFPFCFFLSDRVSFSPSWPSPCCVAKDDLQLLLPTQC
ncbi:hypothetical protein LEMLEM_LOCUS9908, partial [Lemmus lemmus]